MANLWNAMHLNDINRPREHRGFSEQVVQDISGLPWSKPPSSNPAEVMEFKAIGPGQQDYLMSKSSLLHTKRKPTASPAPCPIPCKKVLTEDIMASHLGNLHISAPSSSSPFDAQNYTVNMCQWDLERKLRTAQKITISKEILELDKDNPNCLLPEILLNRMMKPCSALVLWQPPPTIESLVAAATDKHPSADGDEEQRTNKRRTDSQPPRDAEEMET